MKKRTKEINKVSKETLKGLKPGVLWDLFYDVSRIPRPSKKEEKVVEYLSSFAKKEKLKFKKDKVGNILIKVPESSKKFSKVPSICFQSHVDMVCEKVKDYDFDFDSLPIEIIKSKGYPGWIEAKNTTLGADNGIGVAMALAMIVERKKFDHGKFEALFTVDEETGLTGAFAMEKNWFESKYMINIDSEDWGEACIGCAGSSDLSLTRNIQFEKNQFKSALHVEVGGLKGGHSGCDIHIERANAIKILVSILRKLQKEKVGFSLSEILADSRRNSIPRSSEMTISTDNVDEVKKIIGDVEKYFKKVYSSVDPSIYIKIEDHKTPSEQLQTAILGELVLLLDNLPHGVIRKSHDLENIVETSNNLANIYLKEKKLDVCCMIRSLVNEAVAEQLEKMRALATFCNFEYAAESTPFPCWKPQPKSEILDITKKLFKKETGKELDIRAVHAGLECGILKNKTDQDLDVFSIGGNIQNPHTPDERMEIATNSKCYKLVKKILVTFAKMKK